MCIDLIVLLVTFKMIEKCVQVAGPMTLAVVPTGCVCEYGCDEFGACLGVSNARALETSLMCSALFIINVIY